MVDYVSLLQELTTQDKILWHFDANGDPSLKVICDVTITIRYDGEGHNTMCLVFTNRNGGTINKISATVNSPLNHNVSLYAELSQLHMLATISAKRTANRQLDEVWRVLLSHYNKLLEV